MYYNMPINAMTDPNTRQISGPINIIRMEGNINGTNKVIYLFMDFHQPVEEQTECKNIFSPDIQKYFVNSFYNLSKDDRMYDFFLEIYPTRLINNSKINRKIANMELKQRYIDEIMKFFRKIFNYDKKKNKVMVNQLFKNIRLHYLDIRNYYKYGIQQKLFELMDIRDQMVETEDLNVKDLRDIINIMEEIKESIQYIIDVLYKIPDQVLKSKIIKPETRTLDKKAIEYLANKLKTSYHNKNVQEAMLKLIEQSIDNFHQTINFIDATINEYNGYISKIEFANKNTIRKMIDNISRKMWTLVENKITEFFARFTDIYFLRRFLDKKYITNAIVYTGAYHSSTYIYFLINWFNFKITNVSFPKVSNMQKLNRELKNRSLPEIEKIIIPDSDEQCSDMMGFPEDFL